MVRLVNSFIICIGILLLDRVMRILLFIDSLGAGGAQRQLVGLARMLKEDGEQVKVITYHNDPFYLPSLEESDIEYENVGKAKNKYLRLYYIHKVIKQYKPDWVIAYLDMPCILACVCKLLGGEFKLLVSERNTTQKLTVRERLKFWLFRWADKIVPNSYSQERFILANNLAPQAKVKTITNFVDTDYFRCERERVRKAVPEIAVVATIWPSKNALGFIEAVRLLRDKGEKFVVNWYGKSDAYREYIEACQWKIEEYHLKDCIILRDKLSKIREVYLNADYFCLPSFYEGTPNALCEAISCGLPVLCSDVCDNSMYVREGVNGLLFNPNLAQEMADKISCMLSIDDEIYTEYSHESRRLAEELLSENSFISSYKMLLGL